MSSPNNGDEAGAQPNNGDETTFSYVRLSSLCKEKKLWIGMENYTWYLGTIVDHKSIKIIEYLSCNCVRNRAKTNEIFNLD